MYSAAGHRRPSCCWSSRSFGGSNGGDRALRRPLFLVVAGLLAVVLAVSLRPAAAPPLVGGFSRSCDSLRSDLPSYAIPVLWVGTSLTAGLGVPAGDAFPSLVGELAREHQGIRLAGVVAARGGTTVDGALSLLDPLADCPFRVVVLELGVNEAMAGRPPGEVSEGLRRALAHLRELWPGAEILLVSTGVGPWHGREYREHFEAIYRELADKTDAALVPPVLEGIGLEPEYTIHDGLHPNAAGHRIIARRVWEVLRGRISSGASAAAAYPGLYAFPT